jgi:ATP-dependent exoDNAse (exonuclease V) beta subunit
LPRSGTHEVLWFDPSLLELDKETRPGIANADILQGDPNPGLARLNEWKTRRLNILESGSRPTFQITAATSHASSEQTKVHIETVSITMDGSRARGRRFGTLVRNMIRDADFDSNVFRLERLAQAHAATLGSSEEEIGSAVQVVRVMLQHPVVIAAAGSASVHREYPFVYKAEDGKIVEGSIDLLYQQDGEWIIVDFKTGPADRSDYRRQVEVYARALRPRSVRAILFEVV